MGRRQSTSTRNLVIFFQGAVKQTIRSHSNVLPRAEKGLSEKLVLQKGMSSRCDLFIHKLSKHDHAAAEVQTLS